MGLGSVGVAMEVLKITSNRAEETGFKVSLENIRRSMVGSC